MRRRRFFLGVALLLVGCSTTRPASTTGPHEVSGVLAGTTVLSGEVLLVGDVLVPAGSTLRLLPGTTLRVRVAESTKIDPEYLSPLTELLIRGSLQAVGTPARPVRLLPERPAAAGESAWAGVLFDGGAGILEQVEIAGAETGVYCIGAAPQIRDCRILGSRYGVVAQRGSAPLLRGNTIADGEGGVFCWLGSTPELVDNRITGNAEEGIFVDADSHPRLGANQVSGNAIGLALAPRDLRYEPAGIRGNREDVRFLSLRSGP